MLSGIPHPCVKCHASKLKEMMLHQDSMVGALVSPLLCCGSFKRLKTHQFIARLCDWRQALGMIGKEVHLQQKEEYTLEHVAISS